MRNFSFVLWMLGWPLLNMVGGYLNHLMGQALSGDTRNISSLIALVVWAIIASLLYEKRSIPKVGPTVIIRLPDDISDMRLEGNDN